jgi:hypothetical protein
MIDVFEQLVDDAASQADTSGSSPRGACATASSVAQFPNHS